MRLPDPSNIHRKRGLSVYTPFLAPFSCLYWLGTRLRLAAYGRIRKQSLPGFVVSLGNLTAGGTGKTPAACMLAEWARGEGYRTAILSRGYGGSYREKVLEVSDGNRMNAGHDEAGDEPCLLSRRLRGVPVILAKRRYLAGLFAHERFGTNFFVLDDGFQHLALKRDLDLVLMDASDPFGNGRLLPWGPLREPVDQLRRADAVILTRSDRKRCPTGKTDLLGKRFPDKPLFHGSHSPEKVVFPGKNRMHEPEFLRGKSVIAFAGIGRPEAFADTLVGLGTNLVFFQRFRDHHPFRPDEIRYLMDRKERMHAEYLLTTEKDWIRLENLVKGDEDLAYLTIRFTLPADHERFFRMVGERAAKVLGADR